MHDPEAPPRLHDDELPIDADLARRLVADQFPQWSHLPLRRVRSSGTVHAIYRMGDSLAMRLPRLPATAEDIARELTWLPRLAPLLPLEIQQPIAKGEPSDDYPAHWSVWRWLEGEEATLDRIEDPGAAARGLGGFVAQMQRIDPAGGPASGPANGWRGAPLSNLDETVRSSLEQLTGRIDTAKAAAAWEESLTTPSWRGEPVWLHGDLSASNLLARFGKLTGVIDFGCLGVGDPGCDTAAAWMYLPASARQAFRAELDLDGDAFTRGRGWALFVGIAGLPYYTDSNPAFAAFAEQTILAVLEDFAG